jgi:hypothetical protein
LNRVSDTNSRNPDDQDEHKNDRDQTFVEHGFNPPYTTIAMPRWRRTVYGKSDAVAAGPQLPVCSTIRSMLVEGLTSFSVTCRNFQT